MKHCLACGETHDGNCDPSSFAYFRCARCGNLVDLPRDALFGLDGMFCGCGVPTWANWERISYNEFKEFENAKATNELWYVKYRIEEK